MDFVSSIVISHEKNEMLLNSRENNRMANAHLRYVFLSYKIFAETSIFAIPSMKYSPILQKFDNSHTLLQQIGILPKLTHFSALKASIIIISCQAILVPIFTTCRCCTLKIGPTINILGIRTLLK